jgi:hypothetical protein
MERKLRNLQSLPDTSATTTRNMTTMMMPSAFIVRIGIQSPRKAGSSASDVTNGLTIDVPVTTVTTMMPFTSALRACLKHSRNFGLYFIPVYHKVCIFDENNFLN